MFSYFLESLALSLAGCLLPNLLRLLLFIILIRLIFNG